MRKFLLVTLALFFASISAFSQVGQGALKGEVTEKGNGLPIPFANVIVKQNGTMVSGAQTDFDGKFDVRPIPPGKYDVEITYVGFHPVKISGVSVNSDKTTVMDKGVLQMTVSTQVLQEVVVKYKEPLIKKDAASTSTTIDAEAISKMPVRSAAEMATTVGGTYSKDDGSGDINVRGGRSDANYYYIDGIKVRGSSGIPPSAIGEISVITGGLPAQYGDVTGGVISITTKGVSNKYAGGFELLTSGAQFTPNTYVGLDPYGYNLLEGSISGPLLSKLDSATRKKEPVLGFFLSGNVSHQLDTRPSAVGAWKIKEDVLEDLKANPLRQGFTDNSVIPNSDYLRLNDFERVGVRPNTSRLSANLAGKLDVVTTKNTNLTFGGSLNYSDGTQYNYNHSLFDYENYPQRTNLDWRVFGRFTQRFSGTMNEESASLIKNAYYSIQADYNRSYDRLQSMTHQDRFFDYGYLGKFTTYQSKDYAIGVDGKTGINGLIHQTFVDTLITFEPGTVNPELAALTQRYYELNGWEGFNEEGIPVYDASRSDAYTNYNNIQSGGGLINGDNLDSRGRNVYGIWSYNNDITNSRGGSTDRYFESVQNQIRLSAQGAAQIGDHNIVLGFEYEQRIDKSYSISPRTLWTIARLRSNTHIEQLDTNNPIISYPGPYIDYPRLNSSVGEYAGELGEDNQSFIDYNLRKAIGMNADGNQYLDVFSIDKDLFNIEYFSADELYNGGNSIVSYYGYDPYGNRTNSNPSFDDFFTATNEYGNYTRPIAPFQPIYIAGFIEDKFEFDDLIFRVGVRVDRYDANQQVLKDPYVLFPTVKAGEDEALDLLPEGTSSHPGNIGDDYVVYVDNVESPTAILGYRNGKTWYNAEGAEMSDASALRVSNGLPAPLLVDKVNTNSTDVTSESFEDYSPQTNFMPRIAFSFPISDEANFFAHYDVLTKRPTTGTRLDPSDYYYLQSRASSAQLNNPSLQPEKTIDYEVGFQQLLTPVMSLKFSAFYRESRNMVQAIRVFDAYPIEYRTYDNIDFSTVKGMTVTYELRRTNRLSMRAAYTLQFAEGTGSNSTSQLNLARSGQPNLRAPIRLSYDQRHQFVASFDYRFEKGEDYTGPMIKDFRALEATGFNLQVRGGSGEPYNPQSNFTSAAAFQNVPSPLQQGSINNATLPWKFRLDLSVDRDFTIVSKGESQKRYYMNVYLQVKNLLDARNINGVWRATGNPNDDGYLNSAIGIQYTEEQNSPYSYMDYYTLKLWDPTNWELPRRVRLGIRFNF